MSRLNHRIGDLVKITTGMHGDTVYVIQRVEPALEKPYFLTNNEWHDESELTTHVVPDPTWEEVEAHIRHIVGDLRDKFKANDENFMSFTVYASGRPDGDIKIKYTIRDSEYSGEQVSGYSLRPTLDELFRRKKWKERNIPLVLTHASDRPVDDTGDYAL